MPRLFWQHTLVVYNQFSQSEFSLQFAFKLMKHWNSNIIRESDLMCQNLFTEALYNYTWNDMVFWASIEEGWFSSLLQRRSVHYGCAKFKGTGWIEHCTILTGTACPDKVDVMQVAWTWITVHVSACSTSWKLTFESFWELLFFPAYIVTPKHLCLPKNDFFARAEAVVKCLCMKFMADHFALSKFCKQDLNSGNACL